MNTHLPPDFFTDDEAAYIRRTAASDMSGLYKVGIARKLLSLLPEPGPEPGDAVQFREKNDSPWWPDDSYPLLRYEYVGRLPLRDLIVLRRFNDGEESLASIPGTSPLRKDRRS